MAKGPYASDLFIFVLWLLGLCTSAFSAPGWTKPAADSLLLVGFILAFKFLVLLELILESGVRRKPSVAVPQSSAYVPARLLESSSIFERTLLP